MPTPEEVAAYHRHLAQLEERAPGSNPIVLDATLEDSDWLHPIPEEFDAPTPEQRKDLQDALERSSDPSKILGPEPPAKER